MTALDRDLRRCSTCHISEDDARVYPTGSGSWLCWRDFENAAPRGFTICRVCFYEKPVGLPCGEPCV